MLVYFASSRKNLALNFLQQFRPFRLILFFRDNSVVVEFFQLSNRFHCADCRFRAKFLAFAVCFLFHFRLPHLAFAIQFLEDDLVSEQNQKRCRNPQNHADQLRGGKEKARRTALVTAQKFHAKTENTVKYTIDKKLRWELRDILDQLNINERMIQPGTAGIAKWLARHYFVKSE